MPGPDELFATLTPKTALVAVQEVSVNCIVAERVAPSWVVEYKMEPELPGLLKSMAAA